MSVTADTKRSKQQRRTEHGHGGGDTSCKGRHGRRDRVEANVFNTFWSGVRAIVGGDTNNDDEDGHKDREEALADQPYSGEEGTATHSPSEPPNLVKSWKRSHTGNDDCANDVKDHCAGRVVG